VKSRRRLTLFVLSILSIIVAESLSAQAEDAADETATGDLNALFDDADDSEYVDEDAPPRTFLGLFRPGFGIYADYTVVASYLPGWGRNAPPDERAAYAPWGNKFHIKDVFSAKGQDFGAEMRAIFGLDVQVSTYLRFWQSIKFSVPNSFSPIFDEFYCDYNLANRAFFRIGRYNYGWGMSPNFPYTNLLIRIPDNYHDTPGELYLLKIDIPVGIGGFQLITYTRDNYVDEVTPQLDQFAFGGKFNFATPFVDVDFGTLYPPDMFFKNKERAMPWRSFISAKSTIFRSTEIYTEGLVAFYRYDPEPHFSGSFGFYQDFFDNKIKINGEVFINNEFDSKYYQQSNPLEDKKENFPFIPGTNIALNVAFKPGGLAGLKIAVQSLYNYRASTRLNSGKLIPGISITPAEHLTLYFAAPLVFGNRNGEYFKINDMPFSFVFAASLNGSFQFTHY
jgi:hypothetical protein